MLLSILDEPIEPIGLRQSSQTSEKESKTSKRRTELCPKEPVQKQRPDVKRVHGMASYQAPAALTIVAPGGAGAGAAGQPLCSL